MFEVGERLSEPSHREVLAFFGDIYYVVFDGYTNELQAFQLEGDRYRKMELTESRV